MQKLAQETLDIFGVRLTPWQIEALERYQEELLIWNSLHNLTAVQEPEKIRVKHFLDSISCVLAIRGTPNIRGIDVGTGAGFPGLVLKILYPALQLTLVESVGKKVEFCEHLIKTLGLNNVTVCKARAEEIGQVPEHREAYDWVVARAVANMPVLAEYLLPLARVGGFMLAMKGETGPAEAHRAEHAYKLLGGKLRQLIQVELPGIAEKRYLVIVDKIAATPPAYPRRVGIPSKRPLLNIA